jgi:hypothetical protein
MAELGAVARQQRVRTAVMIEDFRALHRHLEAAGVAEIPFKGLALAHTAYPSPSLRFFDDIDLLVRRELAEAAEAALDRAGFIPHPNAPRPEWHHLVPHIHRHHGTAVEIHTDLVRRGRPGWPVEEIRRRATPGEIAGVPCLLLAPADALLATALHARHNLYNRLSFFLDAALLARQLEGHLGPGGEVEALAREAGSRVALSHLLEVAGRLFGAPLPGPPSAAPWRARLAARVGGWRELAPPAEGLRQGPLPRLIELALMDSWADTVAMAWRLLFPPADFVRAGYSGHGSAAGGYGRRIYRRARLAAAQLAHLRRQR